MTIQAIFFDMGGTIETLTFDDDMRLAATHKIYQWLVEQGLNPGLPAQELYQVIKAGLKRYNAWKTSALIELDPVAIWRDYIFAGLPLPPEKIAAVAEELTAIYETNFYHREVRPELPAVLEALRQRKLKIGCISNTMSRTQVYLGLQQYGIIVYFNPIVLSSLYGRRKPDPAIFLHAAQLAGVPPANCAYIGDTISRDVLGARRAGFRLAIRIAHWPLAGPDSQEMRPDYDIQSFDELLPLLAEELKKSSANTSTTGQERPS